MIFKIVLQRAGERPNVLVGRAVRLGADIAIASISLGGTKWYAINQEAVKALVGLRFTRMNSVTWKDTFVLAEKIEDVINKLKSQPGAFEIVE